jgi:hypothetical protein
MWQWKEQAVRIRQTTTVVNLVIQLAGVVSCIAGQDLPALKDVVKNDFLMGGAYD